MQQGIINKGELGRSAARRGSQYLLLRLARKAQIAQKTLARQAYNLSSEEIKGWLKDYRYQCKLLTSPTQPQIKTPKRHFKTRYDEDELLQCNIPWRDTCHQLFTTNKSSQGPQITQINKIGISPIEMKDLKLIASKRQKTVESPTKIRLREDTLLDRKRNNPQRNNPQRNNPQRNNPQRNNPQRNNPQRNNPQRSNPQAHSRRMRVATMVQPIIQLTEDRLERFMRHLHGLAQPECAYDSDRPIDESRLSELIASEYLLEEDVLTGKKVGGRGVRVPFACFVSSKQTKKSIHHMINMPLRYALRLCFDLYDKDGDGYIGNQDVLQLIYLSTSKPALGVDALRIASALGGGEACRTSQRNEALKFDPQRLFTMLKEDQVGKGGNRSSYLSFNAFSSVFQRRPNGFYDVLCFVFGLKRQDFLGECPEGCLTTDTQSMKNKEHQEESLEQRWEQKQLYLRTIKQHNNAKLPALFF